jgi:ATP-dependent RNA helicase HelY
MTDPTRFAARYPFALDDFQVQAIEALHAGESVLVAAPTGSGKTVVAEFALERAMGRGGKCFYTTPLKALSNQKFGDFVARHGAAEVGLLPATTRSARGSDRRDDRGSTAMLYEQPTLEGSIRGDGRVHYLQDPYRGAVWEV